jgi:hypothetical protein
MKVLLDENLPFELRPLLMPMHEVFTVAWMGWKGIANGELLRAAAAGGFEVLITMDRGIEYEQNPLALPCSVVVLTAKSTRIDDVRPLVPPILAALASLQPQSLTKVG